jgi:hypothetical protein
METERSLPCLEEIATKQDEYTPNLHIPFV